MKYITLLIIFLNMFASVAAKDLHNKILHLPQDGSFIDAVPFKVADWEKRKVRLKLRNLGGELEKFPEINTEFQRKKGKIILRGEFLLSASFEEKINL